jgi:C1A family cysteine protease
MELKEPGIKYYPIDYRSYMNPVVNQGDCNACWAFAATASIEGRYSIKYGYKIKLSEQQMIDCCYMGCHGGLSNYALACIMKAGGQMRESDYPYIEAKTSIC